MPNSLNTSVRKVERALKAHGLECQVLNMKETTRSAQDAANSLGCQVEQIVKSLVFMTKKTKQPILVVASGANRVNTKKIRNLLFEPIKMADPDFVRAKTGFVVGGVPPLGHSSSLETFIDEDLLKYPEIWAAAGSSNTMFKLSPDDLQKITQGQVISVT
ncbi:MAG: YbaK/EbsC family protein [Deltaproteobacteria bacterium]|nr:MAG: YbaK/EbsC family protein [Deltaproteobacteria bacterium]